ncbi:CoA-binding protein [Candidatus Micrarchaeota archaeon]|nr:CoA-binding protein [Candidatus Micrarchaeota archaeon]
MKMMVKRLDRIFYPKSVAIVGATPTTNKIGNVVLKNFVEGMFDGEIYPVNPKYDEILGRRCYPQISKIAGKIDCAVLATPADTIPEIMNECAKKKVGGIVMITSGFEESGRTDIAEKIREIAVKNNMPVVGPNCLGVFNPYSKIDSIFLPMYKLERPRAGNIAFITQSGAVGSTIIDLAAYYGVGISKFISYGNATVLDESDYLEYVMNDKETKVIILYIEGVKDGRKFLEIMKKVNKKKPIIVLKGGQGRGGQAAAKSHTGNIAGSYMAYNAAFKQAKVIEADGLYELFDIVKIFNQPKPKGDGIGIITNGGGLGIITTDFVEKENLHLAEFSESTKKEIAKILPPYGNVGNPLDLVADSGVDSYKKAIEIMMNADEINVLIIVVLLQTPPMDERIIHVLTKASDDRRKPIATISVGGAYTEAYRKILERNGVPSYSSPTAAVKAVERFVTYSKYIKKLK